MADRRGLVKPTEFQEHPVSFAVAQAAGQWRGVVKQVHDGDTLVVFADKGFFDYQMLKLRLADASAPSSMNRVAPRRGTIWRAWC